MIAGQRGAWLVLALGPDCRERAETIAARAPAPASLRVDLGTDVRGDPIGALRAHGAVALDEGWAWSHSPLGGADDLQTLRGGSDATTVVIASDGSVEVRAGLSGAQPLYVTGGGSARATVASRIDLLTPGAGGPATPDADAWAQILAIGGPLAGRTPFEEVRRLRPHETVRRGPGDGAVDVVEGPWSWLDESARSDGTVDEVAAALDASFATIAASGPVQVPLSAGWDSRTLASAARHHTREVSGWTTSKDLGTAREELVARRVARALDLPHTLVHADARGFLDDLERYGTLVDHQTPYHAWLVELAEHVGAAPGTVVDGLGGGVFFGGAFPASSRPRSVGRRVEESLRYVRASTRVLDPKVEAEVLERADQGLRATLTPLTGHREVEALSAYLTRTLPGISLGPYGVFATGSRVATPFLTDRVHRASIAIPPVERAGRQLYPDLLRRWSRPVADLAVLREPPPAHRHRPLRSASHHTAAGMRAGLRDHRVGALLHPELRTAGVEVWQRRLRSHADQHVLRGLWLLGAWAERHDIDDLPFLG